MFQLRKEIYCKLFKKILPFERQIILNYANTQQQSGVNDCGLFAIGFFITLFKNEDPSEKHYIQKKMRKHYQICNRSELVMNFPEKSLKRISNNLKKTVTILLK